MACIEFLPPYVVETYSVSNCHNGVQTTRVRRKEYPALREWIFMAARLSDGKICIYPLRCFAAIAIKASFSAGRELSHEVWSGLLMISVIAVCSLVAVAAAVPFGVTAYGNFKRLFHTGDTSGNVALAAVPVSAGVYGLGALAGLRGEILVWDGKTLVSRGESTEGVVDPPQPTDEAALLVTARVTEWHQVAVPHAMKQREFERYVIDQARKAGVDATRAFPFIARGEITSYRWHVVTGPGKQHGAASQARPGHENNRIFSGPKTVGVLVGFYSAEELEGVISHPGERFHVHYADPALKKSGHLDAFEIGEGFTLLLPRR
jgi:alpha-acetolactate decarboxylase